MTGDRGFGNEIKQALESLLAREQARFPAAELPTATIGTAMLPTSASAVCFVFPRHGSPRRIC